MWWHRRMWTLNPMRDALASMAKCQAARLRIGFGASASSPYLPSARPPRAPRTRIAPPRQQRSIFVGRSSRLPSIAETIALLPSRSGRLFSLAGARGRVSPILGSGGLVAAQRGHGILDPARSAFANVDLERLGGLTCSTRASRHPDDTVILATVPSRSGASRAAGRLGIMSGSSREEALGPPERSPDLRVTNDRPHGAKRHSVA